MIEPPKKEHIQNVVNKSAIAAFHQKGWKSASAAGLCTSGIYQ